jgi:predicted RNase H-like HicB family nuclease
MQLVLKRHAEQPLSTLNLVGHGKKVFTLTDDPFRLVEASENGQLVLSISEAPLERHLKEGVTRISAPGDVTVRLRGKAYRAVYTPDLEVGGYSVKVPELPGCLTEGDALVETNRMARQPIAAWLEVGQRTSMTRPAGRTSSPVFRNTVQRHLPSGWWKHDGIVYVEAPTRGTAR